MLKTIFRIAIMYLVSIFLMRLAGKRAVAQLEVSELVTSFLVSEIACMPITDPDVPLWHAVVFSTTVILFEIIMTKASIRVVSFKHMVIGKPDFLIVNGQLDIEELRRADVSLSELVSAMRKNGISGIEKINYAIQEPDGTISLFPFDEKDGEGDGIQHMLVCDGRLNKTEMERFGYTQGDVEKLLKRRGATGVEGVFYLGIDDGKNVILIEKKAKTKDTA